MREKYTARENGVVKCQRDESAGTDFIALWTHITKRTVNVRARLVGIKKDMARPFKKVYYQTSEKEW